MSAVVLLSLARRFSAYTRAGSLALRGAARLHLNQAGS